MVDGGELAEPLRQALCLDRRRLSSASARGGTTTSWWLAALCPAEAGDEGVVERLAGASLSSSGVPVAITLPSSMPASQSKRSASSM